MYGVPSQSFQFSTPHQVLEGAWQTDANFRMSVTIYELPEKHYPWCCDKLQWQPHMLTA